MTKFLLKNYRSIVSFALLLLSLWLHAFASPTPSCPIVTERFQGLADGTTSNNSSTGWYLDASNVSASGYFAMKSNRFHAQEIGGEGRWYSKVFSVAGYTDIQVAVKITAEGDMNNSEYVKVYYKINGGAETLYDSRTGNFGTIDFISPNLNGNNVQIIVKMYNYNNGGSQTSKYYIEEYRVFKEHGPCAGSIPVSATAGNGGILSCSNPSLTLSASTSASGTTTWSWSGPNSFSSTSSSPSVTVAGTYTVVGTNSAGSGSASVVVSENKTPPVVTATGGNLVCASSIVIGATSSVSNSSYSWTGPGGFTSTSQSTSVSAAGTYTVTVTNPANGCTASQSVTVTAGAATPSTLWTESFTLANNTTASGTWSSTTSAGVFSVQSNEFRVTNIGTSGEGVWTSGSISIAGKSSVTISAGVRSGVSSGGTLENDGASLDYVRFYYKINGGAETLFNQQLGTINSNSTSNTTVTVGSLAGSTLEVIIRARATAADEFYYFDNVQVNGTAQSTVNAVATAGNPLTCSNTTVSLSGNSTLPGAVYSWTGPSGFSSPLQNPVVNKAGIYTLTVTAGGCSATDTALVVANATPPANLTTSSTSGSNQLTCLVGGLTLTGSSSTAGAMYTWTLPNGVVGAGSGTSATQEGSYIFTATNPANGCIAKDTFVVVRNMSTPMDALITGGSQWLTCDKTSVTMTASNALAGVVFNWIGPNGYTSTGPSATMTQPGFYNVIMTHPVTGCNHSIGAAVLRDTTTPANLAIAISSANTQITCTNNNVQLSANSSTTGTTYQWTGPHNYTSSVPVISINEAGEYTLVGTNPATGCKAITTRVVVENKVLPANVTATATANSGQLTCIVTSMPLAGGSSTANVTYAWTAPGFSALTQNTSVTAAGTYTLTVTDPSNGCNAIASAVVTANNTPPAGVSATFSDILTCLTSVVDLTGTSTTPGVMYQWSSGAGFSSPDRVTQTSVAGTYQLRVTDPANGCVRTVFTTVLEDKAPPADVSAENTGPLTCSGNVLLIANTSAFDVDYMWTGPNGFVSFLPVVSVSEPGEYTLIVTDLATNGCSDTATTVVETTCGARGPVITQNTITPVVNAASNAPQLKFTYKAWPNPFNEKVLIEFQSAVNDFVRIELYNSNGAIEKILFKDHVIAGRTYKIGMEGNRLSQGIYYYMIKTSDKKVFSGKLLLIR